MKGEAIAAFKRLTERCRPKPFDSPPLVFSLRQVFHDEVQSESKEFRIRISVKSLCTCLGIRHRLVTAIWLHRGRRIKELLVTGIVTENGAHKQTSMESSIVDTMQCYFKNDKGKMGDLELSIIASAKRYFEQLPPKRPV